MGASSSKEMISRELMCAVKNLNDKLEEALRRHHEAVESFIKDYHHWFQKRTAVLEALSSLQKTIDKQHHNANIASITGSTVSLASGIACLGGLALAPFTGGLSVALSVGGLLGTSAGSLTVAGARIVDFGLSKKALKQALDLVDEDCQETMHLSSLINICSEQQTEIKNIVMNSKVLSLIKKNETILTELLTTPLLKERYKRIKQGNATVDDVFIIMSFLYSGDVIFMQKIHSANKIDFIDLKLVEGTIRAATTLRASIINVKRCTILFKNWRTGLNYVGTASKAARFAKGAMLGLSMVVDVYEVGSTAKEMICDQKSDASISLKTLTEELKQQTEDIASYYLTLVS